jgi:small conductance mechanosensitive channel
MIVFGLVLLFRVLFRIGWWLSRRFNRPQLSQLLAGLVGRLLLPTATIVGLIVGLWFIGVNPGTLLAGVGVIGVIVGLALQDSMSNLAAGMFILIYRPYDVEDIVSAGGVVGKVRAMGLANTSVVTFDNRVLFIPNRKIWSEIIENRSAERVRRVEALVKVSYRQPLEQVFALLLDVVKAHELILDTPEPSVFVSALGDPWIEVKVWAWGSTDDWWTLTTELPRAIRVRFEAEGIETPAAPWVWPERPEGPASQVRKALLDESG